MVIMITSIIWLFVCIYIAGGNITVSLILFFGGIIGFIVYWGVKVKYDLRNYENKSLSNYDETNTIQTFQLPIFSNTTESNLNTLPIKKNVPIQQTNIKKRINKYKELFDNCDTVEEIINSYISFNNEETCLKPSEIYLLKHYIQFNSKFKFQEWTIEDIVKRVKKEISFPKTVTSRVTHTDIETEKIKLIHSLVLVLDRLAKNMSDTTIESEFTKEPIKLNKSLIQRKIELYKNLFADCMTVDEVIEKYIVNYSDVKFEKLEIMILRNYLQYHSIFKSQEWNAQKIERMIIEKLNDMEINVQMENSSVFAIYDMDDVQSSYYLNETIAQKLHPYSLFDEMRKMTSNFYYDKGAEIFYKQAKFMESFEDSYEGYDEFKMYSPTYISMDDNQLRTYFSWRTKVRKGVVLETSLSYVFVYIYELLHEVGSNSPMDGYRKLCSLSNDYSKYDKKIESYLKTWIHDYIIYNKLFEEISEQEKAFFFNESGRMYEIINAKNVEDSVCFTEILNCFSNHNINKSVFFRDYKEDYCNALLLTYKNIESFYLKNRKNTLFDKIFGVVSTSPWYPYRSAVFFNYKIIDESNIRINKFEYYSYKEGDWKQHTIDPYKIDRIIVTEIIKGTEYFMRKLYEYPFQLKYKGSTHILSSMIEKTVVSYCEENGKFGECTRKKERAKKLKNKSNTKPFQKTKTLKTTSLTVENAEIAKEPEINIVEIDRSKLDRIRAEADVVREKLGAEYDFITQNNTEHIVIQSVNAISLESNSIEVFFGALSDMQKQALAIILNGNDISKINELSQKHGTMTEILFDSINELALDTLNDNVIDTAGEPFVYDEYSNVLEEILRGELIWRE